MRSKKLVIILLIIALVSITVFGFSLYLYMQKNNEYYHNLPNRKMLVSEYDMQYYRLNETQSMPTLRKILSSYSSDQRFSVYVEDYSSGQWLGINEENKMLPASLLKIPTLIAILKKIQDNKISLNEELILNERDLDLKSGTLGLKGAGTKISIRDLLIEMIANSDNTAVLTLNRQVLNDEDIINSRTALGIPIYDGNNDSLNSKQMGNTFRNIYFSNYLDKEYSNNALNLMARTNFRSQLPAALPLDVVIAHKVGFYLGGGYYHDCGIVYVPEKPYFICVMSTNVTKKEADTEISTISQIVYEYMISDSSR